MNEWDDFDNDDSDEFERRLRGSKRESTRRLRQAQKITKEEEIEAEIARKHIGSDRRAQEKQLKRKFAELKRIADALNIKSILQTLSQSCAYDCWGPDVASEKSRLCMGIFLNFIDRPVNAPPLDPAQPQLPRLVGVWLYYANSPGDQVRIAVGTRSSEETDQDLRAYPPRQDTRFLTLDYAPGRHSHVQDQIEATLQKWGNQEQKI